MVTWAELEEARQGGVARLAVPCYRIDTRSLPNGTTLRGTALTLVPAGQDVTVDVALLELALKQTPPVMTDVDLPSAREHRAWQVVALNREAVLIMTLAVASGLELPCVVAGDLRWLRPVPEVWPAGAADWALAVFYH